MKIKFTALSTVYVLFLVCTTSYAQQKLISPATDAAMQAASADSIKASITYLADDKLLGRQPGKPGFKWRLIM
jgi:hypothetical protein